MSNFMGAYPDVDRTLTQDGMAADAKAVGDVVTNIRNDVENKVDSAIGIAFSGTGTTCEYDLTNIQPGNYLLIAATSSFVTSFAVANDHSAICYDSNIEKSGTKIEIKNLRPYTTVYVIKIL